jgi:hypothetical protein
MVRVDSNDDVPEHNNANSTHLQIAPFTLAVEEE